MRAFLVFSLIGLAPRLCAGADLAAIPPNTWVPIQPTIVQPAAAGEQGQWINAGWNKLVYDADGKRVLFYDRWYEIKPANPVPYENGWMPLCYDAGHDCHIGMAKTTFYAFRHVPEKE